MTTGLRARARVRAEAAGCGTRLTTLRSDPPVTLRATADGVLYLAASAAGPVGGDEVAVDVEVGPGAVLEVRTVAASLLLPGPGPGPSTLLQRLTVGAGGELRWLPEPVVAVRGCDHRTTTRVELEANASFLWREELLLGRHAEEGGSVLQRLEIEQERRPILRTEHALGPRWPGSAGPAGAGGHRALGVVVAVGAGAVRLREPSVTGGGVLVARAELAGGAVAVTVLADGARALAAALDDAMGDSQLPRRPAHGARNDREAS